MEEVNAMELTGIVLKGRYCILEQIGAGGGGHLYLAKDMELGSFRAVKEIPISQKREARLLRLLNHPCLPAMVDYVEKEAYCYLVMEYISGKSLEKALKEGREFTAEELLGFGITLTEVLGYLHRQKPPVYYGDLKPANLMLSEEGKLYLVDLGSAVFGYTSFQRLCTGTRGYAAPEQFQGRMGKTSDVYSLGKTLEALMGKKRIRFLLGFPEIFLFTKKCCRREEKYRYPDMEAAGKTLRRLKKKQGRGRYAAGICLLTVAALFLAGAALLAQEKKPDFWTALTRVTEEYYKEDFADGDEESREKICRSVQKGLWEMLGEYGGEEEKSHILRLLEANGRLLENFSGEGENTGDASGSASDSRGDKAP